MLNLWVCDEEGQDGGGKPSIPLEASHDDRWKPYKSSNGYQQAPAQSVPRSAAGAVFSYHPQTADTISNCPSGDARQFQQVPVVSIGGSVADTKSRDFDRGSAAGSMCGPSFRNFYNRKQEYQHLKQQQQLQQQGHSYTAQRYSTGHFVSNQITNQHTGSVNGSNATGSIYGYQQGVNQTKCPSFYESQSNHGNTAMLTDTNSANCYNTSSSSTYDYNYEQNQQAPPVVPATYSTYSYGEYAAPQHPSHCNGSSYEYNTSSQPQIQSKSRYGSYSNIDVEREPQWQVESAPQKVQATQESQYDLDLQQNYENNLEGFYPTGETDQQHDSPSPEAGESNPEPDTSFRDMYNNLCLFAKTYGHTNVPRVTSWFLLGKWVEDLRKRKRFQILQARGICVASDLQSTLTDHEIDLLENIGFNWNASTPEDNEAIIAEMKRVDTSIVEQAATQMRKASSETVPTPKPSYNKDVPVDMPLDFDISDNGNLDTMKYLLKECALLETSPSTADSSPPVFEASAETSTHESLLKTSSIAEEEGELVIPAEVSSSSDSDCETIVEQMWSLQYKHLTDYKRIHGHTAVPARYSADPKLGHWVMTQRRQYQLLKKGKSSRMTKERVEVLDQLDFQWFIRTNPKAMWNTRLKELSDYKLEHGDCLVPQRYAENTKLGIWVNTQRRHYKLLKEGKKSCMTEERLKKLEDIGFNWSKIGTK